MNAGDPRSRSEVREALANITASGRLEALNKRIELLVENPEKDKAWWSQVFFCLWIQVSSEYLLLRSAYEEQQRKGNALIAWRTRNLLELSVWCLYCAKSKENAHRLYEDAGRDERWFYTAFTKWGIATAQIRRCSTRSQERSKTFRSGRQLVGSNLWRGLARKSESRPTSAESARISGSATECYPSFLTQPRCKF